jgi:aryl-alcohol dehydrogenase-like predicted oxidoreductase
VAIAWLLARRSVTAPIASVSSLGQLNELEATLRIKVSAEDIALLDQASAQ